MTFHQVSLPFYKLSLLAPARNSSVASNNLRRKESGWCTRSDNACRITRWKLNKSLTSAKVLCCIFAQSLKSTPHGAEWMKHLKWGVKGTFPSRNFNPNLYHAALRLCSGNPQICLFLLCDSLNLRPSSFSSLHIEIWSLLTARAFERG